MKVLIVLALVGLSVAQIQVQLHQNPHPLPPMQIQIPIQRPQQPIGPPQQRPAPPNFPRNTWRDGEFDSRCPNPDDHEGLVVFLPGPTPNTFFKCWGTYRWPFECDNGQIWNTEKNVCDWPANGAPPPLLRPNWPNFRPFEENEDAAAFEVAEE